MKGKIEGEFEGNIEGELGMCGGLWVAGWTEDTGKQGKINEKRVICR